MIVALLTLFKSALIAIGLYLLKEIAQGIVAAIVGDPQYNLDYKARRP